MVSIGQISKKIVDRNEVFLKTRRESSVKTKLLPKILHESSLVLSKSFFPWYLLGRQYQNLRVRENLQKLMKGQQILTKTLHEYSMVFGIIVVFFRLQRVPEMKIGTKCSISNRT